MLTSRSVRALVVFTVLAAALVIRITYIESTPYKPINDGLLYNQEAGMIARDGDYSTSHRPGVGALGSRGPIAYFPPAFPYTLAAVDLLDGRTAGDRAAVRPERIEQAVFGTLAVGLLGLVALEALGSEVALVAMVLAAAYPAFIELSGILAGENLLVVLELAACWTALRARRSARPLAWIAATGGLTGLATLTHQNAVLLLVPLAFAAVAAVRAGGGRAERGPGAGRALAGVGVLVAMTVVMLIPWTVRNLVVTHRFLPISDETGITLVGAYNAPSASNGVVPYKWRLYSQIPEDRRLARHVGRYSEVQLSSILETQALNYIGAHPLAPVAAAFDNTLRMFELEGSYAWQNSARVQGISPGTARTGIVGFWIVCLLALAGVFTRSVRAAPRWMWAFPVLFALSVALINVETPRFREPVDPFLILLAACAIVTAARRLIPVRSRSALGGAPVGSGGQAPRLAGRGQLIEMVQRLT